MIKLIIYSRPGCHLCDEMKETVKKVARAFTLAPVNVVEIDISSDPALEAEHGLEIPVLLVDGKKTAKYRIGEKELRRALAGRAGWAG